MVKEQLLSVLPKDVQLWVRERRPKNSAEAGQLAEDYMQARSMEGLGMSKKETTTQDKAPPGKCPRCGEYGYWARNCPKPHPKRNSNWQPRNDQWNYTDGMKCFSFNEKGHFATSCPNRSLYCIEINRSTQCGRQERVYHSGIINGTFCTDIMVDNGASRTVVRRELVFQDDILDGEVTIQCAHGDVVSYPIAIVKITVGGHDLL